MPLSLRRRLALAAIALSLAGCPAALAAIGALTPLASDVLQAFGPQASKLAPGLSPSDPLYLALVRDLAALEAARVAEQKAAAAESARLAEVERAQAADAVKLAAALDLAAQAGRDATEAKRVAIEARTALAARVRALPPSALVAPRREVVTPAPVSDAGPLDASPDASPAP